MDSADLAKTRAEPANYCEPRFFFLKFLLGIIVEVEVVFDSDMRHLLLNQKEASDGLGGKGSGVDGREACDIKVLCVY